MAVDAMNVPVKVDATGIAGVQKVVIVVEHNPIRRVLAFAPGLARPVLSFRFKLEQSSQVRAAAQDEHGLWHVGSGWVESSGGGCTLPGASRSDGSWARHLGEVDARLGSSDPQESRLKVRIMHPMDTGLVSGIPAFHIEHMSLSDDQARHYMELDLYEPVAENPVFSFDLPKLPRSRLMLTGRDNDGNRIEKVIEEVAP
jgi:sulfur-oxidizing protein SoxY